MISEATGMTGKISGSSPFPWILALWGGPNILRAIFSAPKLLRFGTGRRDEVMKCSNQSLTAILNPMATQKESARAESARTESARAEIGSGTSSPERRTGVERGKRALLMRFFTGALVIASLIGIVYTFTQTETKISSPYPEHLESVNPENSSQNVPSQSTITADLEFGYTGSMVINGHEIPKDQLVEVPATGTISFSPGEEQEFGRLPGGALRLTIEFWPVQGSRDDSVSYSWTVNVN
jgi:hypothetical protein